MSYNAHGIRLEFVIYFVHRAERTRGAERGEHSRVQEMRNSSSGDVEVAGAGRFEGDGEGRGKGRTKINGKRTGCYRCYPSLLFLPGTFSSLTFFSALPLAPCVFRRSSFFRAVYSPSAFFSLPRTRFLLLAR